MMNKRLLLLLPFCEDDIKMASIRWKRFKKHLQRRGVGFEWIPIRLPFCDESANAVSKAACELKVLRHAWRLSNQLAQNQNARAKTVVVASIPTLDPLYVGAMLKHVCGSQLELVLEIRDVYARPEMYAFNAIRRRLEVFKERVLIKYVDKVICLTDEIKRRYCMYYPHLRSIRNAVVITNGYDPAEYAQRLTRRIQPQFLDVGYFGSFYGSRNPELLLQVLHRLEEKDRDTIGKVRLHLWGELGDYPLQKKVDEYRLHRTVISHGLHPHDAILEEYSTMAVNLIITHRAGSAYALPGKLFEYMGAGRPVWAITDDPILRDFIRRHRLGYLSSHNVESVQRTLRTLVRDHATGRLSSIDSIKHFEVATLTRKLERFLMNGCSAVQQDKADGRSSGEWRNVLGAVKRPPKRPLVVGEAQLGSREAPDA